MAITRDRIESLWMQGELATLARELAERRTEWSAHSVDQVPVVPGAPSLGILTLLELGASPSDPLIVEMGAALAAGQDSSGGWDGPGSTALVLRALSEAGLEQACYARGLAFLSISQDRLGAWARDGERSFHETALVITMLGDRRDFRSAVDVDHAIEWYEESRSEGLDLPPGRFEASERQWDVALQRIQGSDAALSLIS
jgi:hypothetical protein